MYDHTLDETPPQYFERIFKEYWPQVYKYAHRLTRGTGDEANDIAQIVFIKMEAHLQNHSPETIGDPGKYLMKMTKHCVFNEHRGMLSRSLISLEHLLEDDLYQREKTSPIQFLAAHDSDEPEFALEIREQESEAQRSIEQHIAALPLDEKSKKCLKLRFIEERSCEEIASLLNLQPGNVKYRISRGKGMLRTRIKPEEHDRDNNESVIR